MAKDIVTKAEILGGEIDVRTNFGQTVKVTVSPDPYMGDTEVTPSAEIQVLATKKKFVQDDITVYPAPTETLSTTSNGIFTPSSGKVGFSAVTVDVNPDLRPLSVNENGSYSPDGFDGYSEVTVNNPAEWTTKGLVDGSEPYGDIDLGDTTTIATTVLGKANIKSVTGKQVISVSDNALRNCSTLSELHLPRLRTTSQGMLQNCTSLKFVYLPSVQGISTASFNFCKALETLIFPDCRGLGQYNPSTMSNARNLKTIVLGHSSPIKTSINTFGSTSYAQGGSGGDIYIRKALYDHLGDGSNLDYLADNVWNTLNSYGTITWHPIEGSEYETYMPGGAKYEEEMALT